MELIWKFCDSDITKVRDFVNANRGPEVVKVINRNIYHNERNIDKDAILRTMLTCLLATDANSFPLKSTGHLISKKPYLLDYTYLVKIRDVEMTFEDLFQSAGITKHIKKVPHYFAINLEFLIQSGWKIETELNDITGRELTKTDERKLADKVDKSFKGFGSKEARSFLFALGVTRFEIPIDPMVTRWMEKFGFPLKFSKAALQDIQIYHFISDGLQKICEISEIFPCVLYASILQDHRVLE